MQLFTELGFQGTVQALDESVAFLTEGFQPMSCKVLAGRYEPSSVLSKKIQEDFSQNNQQDRIVFQNNDTFLCACLCLKLGGVRRPTVH